MSENLSASKVEVEENKEKTRRKINLLTTRKIHQIIILSSIHLFYILIESLDLFGYQWISSVIYSLIAISTIAFLWLQKESINYLLPIPFISLVIVGGILEETITTTVIFAFYCMYFFIYQFIKKNEAETILTVIISGLTMLTLIGFTLFDQGFVKINYELNAIVFIWFTWCLANLGLAFVHRKNFGMHFGLIITVLILSSTGPFLGFILVYDNVFALINGILILISIIISLLIVFLEETFNLGKFIQFISANLVAVIVYSFSFGSSFDWLVDLNKMFVIDYALFIPLVLITTIVLMLKFYPQTRAPREFGEYSYRSNKEIVSADIALLITFIFFNISAVFSMIQNFDNLEFIFLKLLLISILYVASTISLNIRITSITSLLTTFVFLIVVMLRLGNLSNYAAFISLLAIVVVVYIFTIINELFLMGEPLTTNLTIVATLVGMVTSIIFFYIENMALKEIWTSISWALIGVFLFAFGIIFHYIFLRRSGLIIILFDIAYTLVAVGVKYRLSLLSGITFIILAFVLITCIYLLRWSERRELQEKIVEEVLE